MADIMRSSKIIFKSRSASGIDDGRLSALHITILDLVLKLSVWNHSNSKNIYVSKYNSAYYKNAKIQKPSVRILKIITDYYSVTHSQYNLYQSSYYTHLIILTSTLTRPVSMYFRI